MNPRRDYHELTAAVERGEPLVDFGVEFVEGVDYEVLTERLNELGDDLYVETRPYYDRPTSRLGAATKPALERLFGWVIRRVPHPSGYGYWWEAVNGPQHYPPGLEGCIAEMGVSQPGAFDRGQPYEWEQAP